MRARPITVTFVSPSYCNSKFLWYIYYSMRLLLARKSRGTKWTVYQAERLMHMVMEERGLRGYWCGRKSTSSVFCRTSLNTPTIFTIHTHLKTHKISPSLTQLYTQFDNFEHLILVLSPCRTTFPVRNVTHCFSESRIYTARLVALPRHNSPSIGRYSKS
jgi:hypothetical protein